jgi:hypothetical protein
MNRHQHHRTGVFLRRQQQQHKKNPVLRCNYFYTLNHHLHHLDSYSVHRRYRQQQQQKQK